MSECASLVLRIGRMKESHEGATCYRARSPTASQFPKSERYRLVAVAEENSPRQRRGI